MISIQLEIDETSGPEDAGKDEVLQWMELQLSALANFTGIQGRIIEIKEIDGGGISPADS